MRPRGVRLGFGERGILEPVAIAGNGDDLGVVHEAVADGAAGRYILEAFASVLERSVAGHDGGARFAATHDDVEQALAGVLRELLAPNVVDDGEIGF